MIKIITLGFLLLLAKSGLEKFTSDVSYRSGFAFLENDFNKNKIKVLKSFKTLKSTIAFVQYGSTIYVVKQIKNPRHQKYLIREALASLVAESASIPVNRSRAVSRFVDCPGRVYKDRAATIHTVVSGRPIAQTGVYRYIDLKQYNSDGLSKYKKGLTWLIICYMSYHRDLPIIAAFDTFIGNRDRSRSNLFYDKKCHQFFGIDLELSLSAPLCEIACYQINRLLNKRNHILSDKQLKGLTHYKNTLVLLIKKNNPDNMSAQLEKIAANAGLLDRSFSEFMHQEKKHITRQYVYAKKLVRLIEKLLNRQT